MTSGERRLRPPRPVRFAGAGFTALLLFTSPAQAYPRAGDTSPDKTSVVAGACAGPGFSEQVPEKYRSRYDRWKETFLSTGIGRELWRNYACNPDFRLIIVVSDGLGRGGRIKMDDYRWVDGRLVSATIVLGHHLDRGYPDTVYYPVLGSLGYLRSGWDDERPDNILAAAKMAHEFGHVDRAAKSDPSSFQLQNELSKVYASHFKSNGYDADDPELVEMADRMGGEPAILSGQREYWAETYALRYLLYKLRPGKRRSLLRLVRKSLASESTLYYLPSQTEWQMLTSFD